MRFTPLADLINYKKEIQLPTGTYDFFFVANETAAMTTALNQVTFRDGLYQKTALTQVPAAIPLLEHIDRNAGIPMTAQLSNTITADNKKGNSLKLDVKTHQNACQGYAQPAARSEISWKPAH